MGQSNDKPKRDAPSEKPVLSRKNQEKLMDRVMYLSRTKKPQLNERVEAYIDVETGNIVWAGKLQRGSRPALDGDATIFDLSANSCWVSYEQLGRELEYQKQRRSQQIRFEGESA